MELKRLVHVRLMGGLPAMHVEARLGDPRLKRVGSASGLGVALWGFGRGNHHDPKPRRRVSEVYRASQRPHMDCLRRIKTSLAALDSD